ncbi:hypothetical protein [Streptomyces sp. NPDC018833]|uniref:hypothetical protein n=1 Tax=Streptomyces sp. NPDC018833 TaxID=3365053 RepID=UPI0037A76707
MPRLQLITFGHSTADRASLAELLREAGVTAAEESASARAASSLASHRATDLCEEVVLGADTHKDVHAAAIVTSAEHCWTTAPFRHAGGMPPTAAWARSFGQRERLRRRTAAGTWTENDPDLGAWA